MRLATMNRDYLLYEMERAERRVKKIQENPDPSKPKANMLLYESERDMRRAQLESWEQGKPFARIYNSDALVRSLGFQVCDLTQAADRTHGERAARYFDIIRREGFTDNACDRTTVLLPLVMNGDFPAPDFIGAMNCECYPIYLAYNSLARQLNIPIYCMDRPPRYTEENLKYVAEQYGNLIEYAESVVPGTKYNEDKLIEHMTYEAQWWDTWQDLYELRKRVPCPIPGREAFRELRNPSLYPDPSKIVAYQRAYHDELMERAEKGLGAVKEEKLRLLWTVSGPYYDDPFEFLGNLGVSVPFWQATNFADLMSGRQKHYFDTTEFGRRLTPLEEVARMSNMGWGDLADRWVEGIIEVARDLKLEGIIYYVQWGCTVTNNVGKVVSDLAEKELGIPTLLIEGRQLDESIYDHRDFFTRLVDFVNVCFERKGLPRLTHDEVVRAGFSG